MFGKNSAHSFLTALLLLAAPLTSQADTYNGDLWWHFWTIDSDPVRQTYPTNYSPIIYQERQIFTGSGYINMKWEVWSWSRQLACDSGGSWSMGATNNVRFNSNIRLGGSSYGCGDPGDIFINDIEANKWYIFNVCDNGDTLADTCTDDFAAFGLIELNHTNPLVRVDYPSTTNDPAGAYLNTGSTAESNNPSASCEEIWVQWTTNNWTTKGFIQVTTIVANTTIKLPMTNLVKNGSQLKWIAITTSQSDTSTISGTTSGVLNFDTASINRSPVQKTSVVIPTRGDEIYEPYCYDAGDALEWLSGGPGWTNTWNSPSSTPTTSVTSLSIPTNYPASMGGKVLCKPGASGSSGAHRHFKPITNGTVYFSYVINVQNALGASSWAGLSIYDEVANEKALIGAPGGVDKVSVQWFDGASYITSNNNSYTLSNGAGNDHTVIGKYDFSTRKLQAVAYYKTGTIPISEPTTWDAENTVSNGHINRINSIKINCGGYGTDLGNVYYDEVRVARSWKELLNITDATWDGQADNANWDSATNWAGNVTPPTTTNVMFYDTISSGTNINLNGARTVAGLRFSDLADTALNFTNNTLTINGGGVAISTGAAGNHVIASAVALGANQAWTNDSTAELKVDGVISGGFSLRRQGAAGAIVLTSNNTFSGGLFVDRGLVRLQGHTNAMGAGAVRVGTNATLELNSNVIWAPQLLALSGQGTNNSAGALYSVNGSGWRGAITAEAATVRIVASGSAFNTYSNIDFGANTMMVSNTAIFDMLGGYLSGSGSFYKYGSGRFLLRPSNNLTGNIYLMQGETRIGTPGTIPAGNFLWLISGSTLRSDSSTARTISKNTIMSGDLGPITLGGSGSQNGALTFAGTYVSFNGYVISLDMDNTNTFTAYTDASGGLTKGGVGMLIMTNVNTHNGVTIVSNGILRIANTWGLGGAGVGTTVRSGAALELTGGIATPAETLSLAGTGIANGGALRNISGNNSYNGAITLTNATRINSDSGTLQLGADGDVGGAGMSLTVGGTGVVDIWGDLPTGAATYTKDGTGTNTLNNFSATRTWSGATTISAGMLQVTALNGLSSNSAVTVSAGATLDLSAGTAVGSIAGAGTLSGGGALIAGGDNTSTTFSGPMTGGGALTKVGTGALTLSGTSTRSGNTTVTVGSLIQNGTNASSPVTVSSGAFVYGGGQVQNLTINGRASAGTASNTVGALAANWVYLENNGTLQVELSAMTGTAGVNWDVLNASGQLTVNAADPNDFVIALKGSPAFNNTVGYTNTIMTSGSLVGFATNKFTINTTEFTPALAGGTFSVNQDGNNIRLIFTAAGAASVPYAVNYTVGVANAVSDGQITSGAFQVAMNFEDFTAGMRTNADYDLVNSSNVVILTNEQFTTKTFQNSGKTLVASDNTHWGFYPGSLGTYTGRWTAANSNSTTISDSTSLSNGTQITFTVSDDDANAPLVPAFGSVNLLTNPGFEIGTNNGSTATGWYDNGLYPDSAARQWSWARMSGTNGLAWGAWVNGAWGYFLQDVNTAPAVGDVLTFSIWAFCENNFTSSLKEAYIQLEFWTNSGAWGATTRYDIYDELVANRGAWHQFTRSATCTLSGITLCKPIVGYGNAVDSGTLIGMSVFWDDALLVTRTAEPLQVFVGGTKYPASDATTNAKFYVSASVLTNLSAGNPFRLIFGAYDTLSSLSRGTTDTNTEMNVDVGALCTNNVAQYVSAESSPDATVGTATSTWKWTTLTAGQIGALTNAITNRITVTVFDSDKDRASDQLSVANQQYGFLVVTNSPTFADMDVLGTNLALIVNNDITPSAADGTDFGGMIGSAVSWTNTFTITNAGNANLTLQNVALRYNSGAAGVFSIVAQPSTPVAGGAATTFRVKFAPTNQGNYIATVFITNNTAYKNPYAFLIQGSYSATATGMIYDWFPNTGNLYNQGGGTGWKENWVCANDAQHVYSVGSFATNKWSCHETNGNKALLVCTDNGAQRYATRMFVASFLTGTVYASFMVNYDHPGEPTLKSAIAGIQFVDAATNEKPFIGKVRGSNTIGFAYCGVATTNSRALMGNGVGTDYFCVVKYDFSTRELSAMAYGTNDMVGEEPMGYWDVSVTLTAGTINAISGIRIKGGVESDPANNAGNVYFDEIRVGTNFYQVARLLGETNNAVMTAGPVPKLIFLGTNYTVGATNDLTITDAQLANGLDKIDFAIEWSNPYGVFMTNNPGSTFNISSRAGRVNPNWDPYTLGSSGITNSLNYDSNFTGFVGYNGALSVTTYVQNAFSITNSTFGDTYFLTASAENNNNSAGGITPANGAGQAPILRAITVNSQMYFSVTDDDSTPPVLTQPAIGMSVGGTNVGNLLVNPGFDSTASWVLYSVDSAKITNSAGEGGGNGILFKQTTLGGWPGNTNDHGGFYQDYSIDGSVSRRYIFSVRAREGAADFDCSQIMMKFEFLDSGGSLIYYTETDIVTLITNYWKTFIYSATSTVNSATVRVSVNFDTANALIGTDGRTSMWDNAKLYWATLADTNPILRVTDGQLALASATYPFHIDINAYDADSGLSRGTTDAATQMFVSVTTLATNNVAQYSSGSSSADSTALDSSNVWSWTSVGSIDTYMTGSNIIITTLRDADKDRNGDRLSVSNITAGYFIAVDDDTNNPSRGFMRTQELIFNPGFETNGAGWYVDLNATTNILFKGSPVAETGSWGVEITNYGQAGWGYWMGQFVDVVPGETYTLSVHAKKVGVCSVDGFYLKAERWGVAGSLGWPWYENNITTSLTTNWQTFTVSYTADASTYSNRVVLMMYSAAGGDGLGMAYFDNISLKVSVGSPMQVTIGSTNYEGQRYDGEPDESSNALYTVTDAGLAGVSAGNPFRIGIAAYDAGSGLARTNAAGTAGSNTFLTVVNLTTNNTTNFVFAESSPLPTTSTDTNIWRWDSFPSATMDSMMAVGSNAVRVTLKDADQDRLSDQLSISNQLAGYLRVVDDDTGYPQQGSSWYGSPLVVGIDGYFANMINDNFLGTTLLGQWQWEAEPNTLGVVNNGLFLYATNSWAQAALGSFHSYAWYNRVPHTYQFTLGRMFTNLNYQVQMFLVGDNAGVQPYGYSDYQNPNVLYMCLKNYGSVAVPNWGLKLLLKTNQPNVTAYGGTVITVAETYSLEVTLSYLTNTTFGFRLNGTNATLFATNAYNSATIVTNITAVQAAFFSTQAYVHVGGRNDTGGSVGGDVCWISNVRVIPDSFSTNTVYELFDGELASVSAGSPLKIMFPAWDTNSGLSRGITDAATQMNVTVVNLTTNNVTNYVAAESAADTTVNSATSLWKWTSFDGNRIQSLMSVASNKISATLHDLDSDRPGDRLSVTNMQFGFLKVPDDDSWGPGQGFNTNVFAVQIGSRTANVVSGFGTTNVVYLLNDADLANASVSNINLVFNTWDPSRINRGVVNTTNMNVNSANWLTNNAANYNAARSIADASTLENWATSTWTFTTFTYTQIGDLFGVGSGSNHWVRADIPDADNDRTGDIAWRSNVLFGSVRVDDEDNTMPDSAASIIDMGLFIGGVSQAVYSGSGTARVFRVYDGTLANLTTAPLEMHFKPRDAGSGIQRDTTSATTNMNVSIAFFATNDVAHYAATLSSPLANTMVGSGGPTSVWRWATSFTSDQVSNYLGAGGWTSPIICSVPDADIDRPNDQRWRSNEQYGIMWLLDDDSTAPSTATIGPGNLLRNSSFELRTDNSDFEALYWAYVDRSLNIFMQDTDDGGYWNSASRESWGGYDGTYVLAFRSKDMGGWTNGGLWQQVTNELGAGSVWEASAYVYNNASWTCGYNAIMIEFYNAGSSNMLLSRTNAFALMGASWNQVSVVATAPANAVYTRWVMRSDGANETGALSIDCASLRAVTNTTMDFMIGRQSFYRSGSGSNALFRVTDGDLASVSATNPMKYVFNVYDTPSGLQRSPTTEWLNYDVGSEPELQNVYYSYSNTLSASDTTVSTSTSVFAHVRGYTLSGSGVGQTGMVWRLMGSQDAGWTNRVSLSGPDADNDRGGDTWWMIDAKYGDLAVCDDDTNGPFHWLQYVGTNFTWGAWNTNPISDAEMRGGFDLSYGLWDDSGLLVTNTSAGSTNVNGAFGNICPNWDVTRPDGIDVYANIVPSATNIYSPRGNGSYNATVVVHNINIPYAQNTVGWWRVQGSAEDWDRDRGFFLRTNQCTPSQVETVSWDRAWSSDWRLDYLVYDDDSNAPSITSNANTRPLGVWIGSSNVAGSLVTTAAVFTVSDGNLAVVGGTNMLNDPGFENGLVNWSAYWGNISNGSTWAESGTNCIQYSTVGFTNEGGFYQDVPVAAVAGQTFVLSGRARATNTVNGTIDLKIEYMDAGLVQLAQYIYPMPQTITTNWQTFSIFGAATPANVAFVRTTIYCLTGTNYKAYFDNFRLSRADTNTMRFLVSVYDGGSALSRGTVSATTQMNLSIGSVIVSNVGNYLAVNSTPDSSTAATTSSWEFANFNPAQVTEMVNVTNNAVRSTVYDNDDDRISDRAVLNNQQFGMLKVVDDDTAGPVSGNVLKVYCGGVENTGIGSGSTQVFEITEGQLGNLTSAPLEFHFKTYDVDSGILRSTNRWEAGMTMTVTNFTTNDFVHYDATRSSPLAATMVNTASSVWRFAQSYSYTDLGSLFGSGGWTSPIVATTPDADNDRTFDTSYLSNQQYGFMRIIDDDTFGPTNSSATYGGIVYYVEATAGATNLTDTQISGSYTSRLHAVADGELRSLGVGTQVWFSFMVRDTQSGIPRNAVDAGTPKTNMNMSLAYLATNNVANFSLTRSSPTTTGAGSSNVWVYNAAYTYDQVTALYGVTSPVNVTVPFDTDDDRANDRYPGFTNFQYCLFTVDDDDASPPILKTWGTPNTNANLALFLGGDPALGYAGGTNIWINPGTSLTNDEQRFVTTDGALTNVSASAPLDFRVWMYDSVSGVSRDPATEVTNTSLTIGSVMVSNVANLSLALSGADSAMRSQFNCSNYWRWTSITRANVAAFYAAAGHSNQIYLTVRNSDFDRANDQESGRTNLGWLVVNDDDAFAPIASDFKINYGFPHPSTNALTDQMLNSGGWAIELTVSDASGVNRTWNGPLWPVNYNLMAPNGQTVIVEKAFDTSFISDTNTVFSRNMAGNVTYTSIVLGVYTMTWSSLDLDDDRDGDQMTTLFSRVINNSTNVITVVDDDTTAPTPPTNVVVTPVNWTNVNSFVMSFSPGSDASGIYQYRADTNTAAPGSVTNGAPLASAYVTNTLPYIISNGSFEVGYHWIEVPDAETTTNGWKDYSSELSWAWWDTNINARQSGTNGTLHVTAEGNQSGNGEGRYTLISQDVWINNTNDLPLLIDYGGYFKGNMSHIGIAGIQAAGFLKLEFFNASTSRIRTVGNEWDDGYGWPLHATNITTWSNVMLRVTNGPADTEMIRFSCGIATHGSGLSTTGFWDNLSMTARVVNISGTGAVFTNAPEGSNVVWLFSVDDDDDRPNDRTKSANTNFTILYDKTAPLTVTNVVALEGTNDSSSEILMRWSPLPNGGGVNLSPWRTYAIFYAEGRAPNINDPFIIWTNGYSGLSTITTTNITLTNFSFGTSYQLSLAGWDQAGNIGPLSTPASITLSGFSVTQGVVLITATNGPSISWTATNSVGAIVKAFDLLYVDAMDFGDGLSLQWQLLDSVTNSWIMDTGSVVAARTPPWQMVDTMRFYRAAQHDAWTTNRSPRAASVEVYGMKTIRIFRGQNWVALPFVPDSNSVKSILGYSLPGGPTYADTNSTRVIWYKQTNIQSAKTEIWLSKSAGQTSWQYQVGGSGTADYLAVPLSEGFIIQIPTNGPRNTNVVMFIGRIPTNPTSQLIKGLPTQGCYNVVSFRGPRRVHPAQMNLLSSGFQGTSDGNPMHSDRIWSLNRTTQRGTAEAWYDNNTSRWRLNATPSYPDVPTNYFGPDDALVIHLPAGHTAFTTWTIPVLYTPPTKNMTP